MPSLGTLTYDLVAKIGGFSDGMTQAERQADKSAKAINAKIESIGVTSFAVGNALGQYLKEGIDLAINAFPALIEQAAKFQDIADKTGGSAEGFANFAVSAKVAGVGIEDIANASVKLTKALIGVDDESKAAGAALGAIGINIEDFKKLRPDEQIEAVAQALGNFEEGASKTAVALDLFGKSGAEVLKFLKDYNESGGAFTILTKEQIKLADDYGDALARNNAKLSLYASSVATSLIPILTALSSVITDVIKEVVGLGGAADKLANDKAIQAFADGAAEAFAKILSGASYVARAFDIIGTAIGASAATGAALANGEFKNAFKIQVEGFKDFTGKIANIGADTMGDRFRQAIKEQKEFALQSKSEMRGFNPNQQQLNYQGRQKTTGAGRADNSAAQEAKAQLQSDLSDIRSAQEAIINTYTNAGKILEAERAAGLKDEQEYYAEKKRLLVAGNDAEQSGLQQQIARLQLENLSGKDAIENNRKIAEAQAKLTKAREDAATAVQVLAIQEESSYKKIAGALLAARQAAQDYYDTTNRGYERMLQGLGQGSKQRDQLAAIQQIEERYQQQRQDLANRRSQAEQNRGGPLDKATSDFYDKQLALIAEFQSKAVDSYTSYYAKLDAAQKDWSIGATEALKNYADEAANTAKLTEDVFTNAFKGLEDQLTSFLTTGKANWKDFANSVIADITRMVVKQQVTGPLASMLGGAIGSSGGSGLLGSIFGSSSGGGGDALGALVSLNGWASGGFTGMGGINEPAGIVHRGEVVWSQSDVRNAGGVGNVEAMRRGRGGIENQNLVFNIQGKMDSSTGTQVAQRVRRETLTAAARF